MQSAFKQNTIKKILYKSCYRGCKETDLIIGGFAKTYVHDMNQQELDQMAIILELPDNDIYDYITHKKPIPEKYKSDMLLKLISYNESKQ